LNADPLDKGEIERSEGRHRKKNKLVLAQFSNQKEAGVEMQTRKPAEVRVAQDEIHL